MKILHLSDFHFINSENSIRKQSKIVDELIKSLRNVKVDIIFFTGDLVYKGDQINDFTLANAQLIERVKSHLSLSNKDIFMCQGNHDVNRSEILMSNLEFIHHNIKNNDELDNFVNDHDSKDFIYSLKPTENFFLFSKKFYETSINDLNDQINPLYGIHKREIDNLKIGIVTLNSSWLSSSDKDYGNLLIPKTLIEKVSAAITDCRYKILLLHHSLAYLKYFNQTEVEDLIFKEFDFLFSGDIHKRKNNIHYSNSTGIVEVVTPAILTRKGDGRIGYSIINFNTEVEEINIDVFYYDEQERFFYPKPTIYFEFPNDEDRKRQNKLRKTLRNIYDRELSEANNLFLLKYEITDSKNFLDLFSTPILRTKDEAEIIVTEKIEKPFEFERFYNIDSNYVIYGKEKSGKTAILKRIQLEYLSSFSKKNTIPVFIDCSHFLDSEVKLDLVKILKEKLIHFSKQDVTKIISDTKILILVDNFEGNEIILEELEKIGNNFKGIHYIIISPLTIYRRFSSALLKKEKYNNLFIHALSKSQLRYITKKWLQLDEETVDQIVRNIVKSFEQFSMPYNYWTLSIFLWIYNKTKHFSFNSNAELLEYYIDKLLDKDTLALAREKKFTFKNYKTYLSEIAFYFYSKCSNTGYKDTYENIFNFTSSFLTRNPRYIATPKEILDYVIEKKVLITNPEEQISFRLNGDFEYFMAFYLSENMKFRNEIIEDDKIYLSFKNELELYSGLKKEDDDFLVKIYLKTKNIFSELNERYRKFGTHDENLSNAIEETINFADATKELLETNPLNYEEQDDLLEDITLYNHNNETEVKLKEVVEIQKINFKILEKHLSILCRVFRNIDEIKNVDLVNEIFQFILDSYCNLGFSLLEEVREIDDFNKFMKNEVDHEVELDMLNKFINFTISLIPVIMQVSLYESLGHINFEKIITKKIDELMKNGRKNQYLLFLLSLMLIDIDIKKNKNQVDNLLLITSNKTLLSCILVKAVYYFIFKSYNNKNLETYFREKIRNVNYSINPEALSSYEEKQKLEESINKKKILQLIVKKNT